MATQLGLYNAALSHLGEAALTTVADAVESRRVLDIYYTDFLQEMLMLGFWKFAIRSVRIAADLLITPNFGYKNAFSRPIDYVRIYDLSASESFHPPLRDWIDESQGWFSHANPIYVRYVSNDPAYGTNIAIFPARYRVAFEWGLAAKAAQRITQGDTKTKRAEDKFGQTLGIALAFDAMLEPPKDPPQGSWVTDRFTRRSNWDQNPSRV